MEIILQKYVNNLGRVGDRVQVNAGYARNYLIPKGFAMSATADNIKILDGKMVELKAEDSRLIKEAEAVAKLVEGLDFRFEAHSHDDGKLFGSINLHHLMDRLHENNIQIESKQISLIGGIIRETGEYELVVSLYGGVKVEKIVKVVSMAKADEELLVDEDNMALVEEALAVEEAVEDIIDDVVEEVAEVVEAMVAEEAVEEVIAEEAEADVDADDSSKDE